MDTTAEMVTKGERTLLEFVTTLQQEFTSIDSEKRENAVDRLCEVICRLPSDFLNELEVETVLEFCCARLLDSALVSTPATKTLHHLCTKCDNYPVGSETKVLTILLKEQDVQSCPLHDRILIYSVIESFMDKQSQGLRDMGDEFILQFMRGVEGEKDPKCLMIVFNLYCRLCSDFSIGPYSEDLFEIVACYFPIDFKPPPNDPYGITGEQLSEALRRAVTAHHSFAKLSLELAQENLEEKDAEVDQRKEALLLLCECLESFPPKSLSEYFMSLWSNIRRNILIPQSEGIEKIAHRALRLLIKAVKNVNAMNPMHSVETMSGRIFQDCEPYLFNVEMQLLKPTSELLTTVVETLAEDGVKICSKLIPVIMEKTQRSDGLGNRVSEADYAPLLAHWVKLTFKIDQGKCVSYLLDGLTALVLNQFSDSVQPIVFNAGWKLAACLLACLQLSAENRDKLIQCVIDGAIDAAGRSNQESSHLCGMCLRSLVKADGSKSNTDGLIDSVNSDCPKLLPYLVVSQDSAQSVLEKILDQGNTDEMIAKLLELLTAEDLECQKSVISIILKPIVERLLTGQNVQSTEAAHLNQLYSFVLKLNRDNQSSEPTPLSTEWLIDAVSSGDTSKILRLNLCLSSLPLKEAQKCIESEKLVSTLAKICESSTEDGLVSWRILCSLLNKSGKNESLRKTMNNTMKNDAVTPVQRIKYEGLMCRAYILANWNPFATQSLQQLFTQMTMSGSTGKTNMEQTIEMLSHVLCQYIFIVDADYETNWTKSLFWRQRLLSQTIPIFMDAYNTNQESKSNYYQILSQILEFTPWDQGASSIEISKLVPIVYDSLESLSGQIWNSPEKSRDFLPLVLALENMFNSDASSKTVLPYATSLLKHLMKIASNHSCALELRVKSLQCISTSMERLPDSVKHREKVGILKGLVPLLDDKKRVIRREAVRARNLWSL